MTVLVAYDGSEQSMHALELASRVFDDQELLLAHIIEPFADHTAAGGFSSYQLDIEWERAESMLDDVIESLSHDQQISTAIRYGRPIHQLLRIANDEDVDHIVIGSHGRDGAKRLLLGSVAETVVRRADVPVTVVRDSPTVADGDPDRVLVPFDGSDQSKEALAYAVKQFPDAEITALYAVYPPRDVVGSGTKAATDEIEDWGASLDDHTARVIELAVEHTDHPIKTATTNGDPAASIVEYAADESVDHIVIGSHGRDGLSRLIMGSVAETVVRRAPTSVTVVRSKSE